MYFQCLFILSLLGGTGLPSTLAYALLEKGKNSQSKISFLKTQMEHATATHMSLNLHPRVTCQYVSTEICSICSGQFGENTFKTI